jgi:hypothetical protein
MPGRNLFETIRAGAKFASVTDLCVFLSHRSIDKPIARTVARCLVAMDVDVYFDEYDLALQVATRVGDDVAIVKCIDDGLSNCTHLLGIITPNTFTGSPPNNSSSW